MGMTADSTGFGMPQRDGEVQGDYTVALAGNPNVGKSTVFNALTGMHQHTGNWAGKTVTNAVGKFRQGEKTYILADLPGTYSLRANSAEEAAARDYLCFGQPDAVIVVCDACCLERNLNLVLQTMELAERVLVCVNLQDEARKKGIFVDTAQLERLLGVPVVGVTARSGEGLDTLRERLHALVESAPPHRPPCVDYGEMLESHVKILADLLEEGDGIPPRWAALRLLEQGEPLSQRLESALSEPQRRALMEIRESLAAQNYPPQRISDTMIISLVKQAERLAGEAVQYTEKCHDAVDRRLDRILMSRRFGIPVMLLLLGIILWLTMIGANYLSGMLSELLFAVGNGASTLLAKTSAPAWVDGLFIQGMYRVLAWVVSVMLPPMAIFFPLFTLLEDVGYLPRVAFNLDRSFRCAGTCGKQSLTMCMGFGCNAAGVTGCRIIDSPRERLIAILTNSFVPCNGRFPMLISLITMFFITGSGFLDSALSALMLLGMILCGVGMTLLVSKILSRTLLKGMPSSFALELPPYRRPQIGRVLLRSVFDRTIFVLGRACLTAAPAGMLIWILANFHIGETSLLRHCAGFLEPFAQLMGLDGTILLAFLLGFPANEIVIPIMIMVYLSQGTLVEITELSTLHNLFVENGWTWVTALCTMFFSLFHFPCSTTCLTILKETGSKKWTLFAMLLPTLCGMLLCMLIHGVCSLL